MCSAPFMYLPFLSLLLQKGLRQSSYLFPVFFLGLRSKPSPAETQSFHLSFSPGFGLKTAEAPETFEGILNLQSYPRLTFSHCIIPRLCNGGGSSISRHPKIKDMLNSFQNQCLYAKAMDCPDRFWVLGRARAHRGPNAFGCIPTHWDLEWF